MVFPRTFSLSMDMAAWLIAQPLPLKAISAIFLSRLMARSRRILSPQRALYSIAVLVGCFKVPKFCGYLKWSRMFSE